MKVGKIVITMTTYSFENGYKILLDIMNKELL